MFSFGNVKKQMFYALSLHDVENALVLLRFQLKTVMFEQFIVFSLKTPYKTNPKLYFCAYTLAKPFVLPLHMFGNVYFLS